MPDRDDINQANSDERQKQEFTDFSYSTSGIDNGRLPVGFNQISGAAYQQKREREKHNDHINHITALQLLLQNAEYAEAYNQAMQQLALYEAETDRLIRLAEKQLADAHVLRDSYTDNANRLHDGRAVYGDGQGGLVFSNGKSVSPHELEGHEWSKPHSSYDGLVGHDQGIKTTQDNLDAIRGFQVEVLVETRDSLMDEDNPVSADKLPDLIGEVEYKMGEIKERLEPVTNPSDIIISSSHIAVPEL